MPSSRATAGARADAFVPPRASDARAEHISLESEPEASAAPAQHVQRKVRFTYQLKSALRGCCTELSILEEHFIAVRSTRPGMEPRSYTLDLRFANAKPMRVRRIAWTWAALTLAFAALSGVAGWLLYSAKDASQFPLLLGVGSIMVLGTLGSLFVFLRRTTESLEFTSAHGQATLISITGGIGSARGGKTFFINLIKSINAAKAARQQHKKEFLRDEMREHHRLRELGVLSEQEYETSKARILAAHS